MKRKQVCKICQRSDAQGCAGGCFWRELGVCGRCYADLVALFHEGARLRHTVEARMQIYHAGRFLTYPPGVVTSGETVYL